MITAFSNKAIPVVLVFGVFNCVTPSLGMNLVVNPGVNTAWAAGNWGQSFTALDGDIGYVGLLLWNSGVPANVTLSLYAGDGTSGSPLKSQILAVPTSSNGYWVDADVGDIAFAADSKYTIVMTGGGSINAKHCSTDSYAYGGAYYQSGAIPGYDLSFRVGPSVPEPATLSLLALGGLAMLRRRR